VIVEVIRIVDRSALYFARSAQDRALHPEEWERRYQVGKRVQERALCGKRLAKVVPIRARRPA
jgi:hypothetical protein